MACPVVQWPEGLTVLQLYLASIWRKYLSYHALYIAISCLHNVKHKKKMSQCTVIKTMIYDLIVQLGPSE